MKESMRNRNYAPRSVWTNPIHFLAFGMGSGCAAYAPGTWGTLMAIPFYLIMREFSLQSYLTIVVITAVMGVWLCHVAAKDTGVHDHPGIVWDEIVGYFMTMIAAPIGWQWVVLGFILFRFFDIVKPWPIGWCDRHVHGGLGIMLDDWLAAIYAWFVLQAIVFMISPR